ncbi:YbhB/YbcL family Raf kinase inhibitor-like protein [Frondihabitans australicus]|uniref:PBP family phospholipid-binding protein n=1 Tax=Frondihabitans australicus TaxID=386892 RepID=A0A495IKL3_9MICO|nr:YbhB/YbcL family Raf kinase inhibitor-like protein [Frondihabitans australicus]RKR75686.1 hypothetical protein C8E83_2836 [Frondihabitans australicus]
MPANPLGLLLRNRRAGRDTLVWARDDLQAPESFELTSPAFASGATMPDRYRGRLRGENVSPPLEWTTPPRGTAELVLIAQDPDVPFGKAALHVLVAGIDPASGALAENALAFPSPVAGLRQGKGVMGRRGWAGPMPVRSHGPHAYVFQMFAADQRLELPSAFGLDDLLGALRGHVLGRATTEGLYEIA